MLRVLHVFGVVSILACFQLEAQIRTLALQSVESSKDEVCASCHVQTTLYMHTAHRATSSLASETALAPIFKSAGMELTIAGSPLPKLAFLMGEKDGLFSETAVSGWGTDVVTTSGSIDVIVGSSKRGQTFLSWSGDQLFELPVSYWKEGHRWINSPGYVDGTADFRRPVQAGCLECHVTSITSLSSDATANRYERASLVTGIGCRTCHGPSEAHVAAEQAAARSRVKVADPMILNPARFSRDRQIDMCALCHSGIQRTALQPAFSYVPGQPLAHYFGSFPGSDQDRPDVHGNQVGLLERSRCFRSSAEMTCSTCHDVHTSGQSLEAYAKRCLTCHQWQNCGEAEKLGASIQSKCIGCHMPLQQTDAIISVTAGQRVQATMRTHWIKVYAADSKTRQ